MANWHSGARHLPGSVWPEGCVSQGQSAGSGFSASGVAGMDQALNTTEQQNRSTDSTKNILAHNVSSSDAFSMASF